MKLLKQTGILYDTSLQARDEPYELLLEGQPSDLWSCQQRVSQRPALPDVGANGAGLLPSPELIFETFKDDDVAYREWTLFIPNPHPHVVGMRSRIIYLDRLVQYIKGKPGV